jgi:hypothetical protein
MNHIYYFNNSYIHFVVYDNIYIVTLRSFNKGEGTILLNDVIIYANHIFKNILLDDMTTRYREDHNIYIKYGFKYIHDDGPEMLYIHH